MPKFWSIEEKNYGTSLVLMPGWDLDVANQFLQFMENSFNPANHKNFIIDLSRVEHLDSMVIGIIVSIAKKIKKSGGKVALLEPVPKVEKLFADIGLLPYFLIFNSKQELMDNFGTQSPSG